MSAALENAVRRMLDHGRNHKRLVVVPADDFNTLAGCYKAEFFGRHNGGGGRPATKQRDPDYEREMRKLFENAELDP